MGLDSSPDPSVSAEQIVASPVVTSVVADAQVATAATDVLRQMIAMEKHQQRKRPSASCDSAEGHRRNSKNEEENVCKERRDKMYFYVTTQKPRVFIFA